MVFFKVTVDVYSTRNNCNSVTYVINLFLVVTRRELSLFGVLPQLDDVTFRSSSRHVRSILISLS